MIVTVKQGSLVGTTGTTFDGQEYYRFLGIPYAKPPLGQLRFKAPEPAEPWEGVKDCTKNGNCCFFFGMGAEQGASEDCLFLNVHTKDLPKPGVPLKPVMVYIHPGGFILGTGNESMADAAHLLTQDIVLVSMNYRLGALGFLSFEDPAIDVPGNAGLKDQTLALKWVQENINKFNGDPNNVTLFGISAGGASIQFHLLSPTSKGLFHKAIIQSGSVADSWAWGQRNAVTLAKKLNKNVNTEKEAIEVLLEVTIDQLCSAWYSVQDNLLCSSERRPFGPVIENPNTTAFLTEDPLELLKSGKYHQVPLIQGINSNEGLIMEMSKVLELNESFTLSQNLVPWYLDTNKVSEEWRKELRNFYCKDSIDQENTYKYLSDVLFGFGSIFTFKQLMKTSSKPLYFYILDYETPLGKYIKKLMQAENSGGCGHAFDELFLFSTQWNIREKLSLTDFDIKAINDIIKIWTNFAKNGDPHVHWKTVTPGSEDIKYFLIAEECKMLEQPFKERVDMWERLLKEAEGINLRNQEFN